MDSPGGLLTGEWRDLAFLSYRVAPGVLAPHVPRGTELDLWRGDAWVSVVALRFLGLSVLGVPVPLHQDFVQVNLRFYVKREVAGAGGPEVRHGVTFLRELVPRPVVAAAARLLLNEPFHPAVTSYRYEPEPGAGDPERVEYDWTEPGGGGSTVLEPAGPAGPLPPGSLEEFIAERCWGYTPQPDGSTVEYRVVHPRWRIWKAERATLEGDVPAAFGEAAAASLRPEPDHAFLAAGSAVAVHPPALL